MADPAPIAIRAEAADGLDFELQRSEARRAEIMAGVFIVLSMVSIVRHLVDKVSLLEGAFMPTMAVAIAATGWYLWLRAWTNRAISERRLIPVWFWAVTVIVESFFPTAALLMLMKFAALPPVDSVRTAAIIAYCILAVTSVLRLRPMLCELGGFACGAQHIILVSHALSGLTRDEALAEAPILYGYSVFIIISWVVAAMIAAELRRHVAAGLREARTRAELAEVTGELAIARQIQQRLMPRVQPNLRGYEIAGWNRPAAQTGGDYYDWISLSNGRIAVAIADVTGHGVGPALIMAVCRAYARATIPEAPRLGAGLARLNTLLADDIDDGRFVTSAYAVLDPESGGIELLSAGHGPTVLRRANGAIEVFGGDGPPLGVVAGFDFEPARSLMLEPGDELLLVTDGFVEAKDPTGRMFGIDRLREFLALNRHLEAGALLRRLDDEVRAYVGNHPQADDMTAVMIRRNG